MNIPTAETWYTQRLDELEKKEKQLSKKRKLLGVLRLLTILLAFTLLWLLFSISILVAILVFLCVISFFLFLIKIDIKNNEKLETVTGLIEITAEEIKILQHQFRERETGERWKPLNHPYAHDLDIFGLASVFQYCNRATSEQGQKLLAAWLLSPATSDVIITRQNAARELATVPNWQQELRVIGRKDHITILTEQKLAVWLKEPSRFIKNRAWLFLQWILPFAGITILALHIIGTIGANSFYPLLFVLLAGSLVISKLVTPAYRQLNKAAAEIDTLFRTIKHIEHPLFQSPLLKSLQNKFDANGINASAVVKNLKSILDRLDYRLNPLVFLPLNTFLFWDLHQVIALEKWKLRNQTGLKEWFSAIAELESVSSLASLHFNHPDWAFPEFSKEEGIFIGHQMGHPLISKTKNVLNDFSSVGLSQVNLITGSNMAGKSTFLRTVGVNTVLAMAGAPVCAASLQLSVMKIMSSMRVTDNLEESTSTFYAELKKLKEIIEAVNRNEKVLLLLDEMLRGTNSADRHTGSEAFIRQLIQNKAVALVATHDLELATLEKELPGELNNYHFDVQVSGDELYFDYKLKDGVCKSMNASLLMKKIGISI